MYEVTENEGKPEKSKTVSTDSEKLDLFLIGRVMRKPIRKYESKMKAG